LAQRYPLALPRLAQPRSVIERAARARSPSLPLHLTNGTAMGMISEFKAFALKGNVVDMAVGVIIGGAFGAIVGSMVSDVMMPVIGLATNGISFSEKFYALDGKSYANLATAKAAGASVMQYGTVLDK